MISSGRAFALISKFPPWLEKLLLALLCWQLAGLFWLLFAPSTDSVSLGLPRPVAEAGAHSQQARAALLRWYGTDTTSGKVTTGDYSLVAVIAGKQGAALFKGSDGVSVAVRVGEALRPGSTLVAVEPNQVTIEQAGVRQQLQLPQNGAQKLIAAGANAAGGQLPSGKALKPIRLTRGQIVAVMRGGNVAGWDKGLASAPEGGIRIEKSAQQPFTRLLKLNDGDLLKTINQRPLNQLADISLISYHFGQRAAVDIDLIRDGVPMTQHYEIQP